MARSGRLVILIEMVMVISSLAHHRTTERQGSSGAFFVFSGRTGACLLAVRGRAAGNHLGSSAVLVGDVNHDGLVDYAVGASGDCRECHAGSVLIVSGDGDVLARLCGNRPKAEFGASLAAIEDLDGDHLPEFVIGEPEDAERSAEQREYWGVATVVSSRHIQASVNRGASK